MNHNSCKHFGCSKFHLFDQVIYIDDAFTLDLNNSIPFGPSYKSASMTMWQSYAFPYSFRVNHKTDLINSLLPSNKDKIYSNLVDDVNLSNDIKLYDNIIQDLLHGNLQFSDVSSSYTFHTNNIDINLANISSGMKTFGILELLIRNGHIHENTCLILDEPESHLHPEWQIQLAKLLVNLVAKLNINLVVNSHSPFFIEAIQVYSKICKIEEQSKYYLTHNIDDYSSELIDVSNNTMLIFDALAEPYNILDKEYLNSL